MKKKIILIGASTGGPSQIKELLCCIGSLKCSIIIIQHMKEEVIPFFIKDLIDSLTLKVQTTPIEIFFDKPSIIVCSHSSIFRKNNGRYEILTNTENQNFTPDINKLFNSFVPYSKEFDIEVFIMTGIGRDGVDGAINLKSHGATIIAQDEESCPVYGMPKAALESGIVDKVKTLAEIKQYIKVCDGFL